MLHKACYRIVRTPLATTILNSSGGSGTGTGTVGCTGNVLADSGLLYNATSPERTVFRQDFGRNEKLFFGKKILPKTFRSGLRTQDCGLW